ncbi:hypothetical protein [Chroococcus sp. FPU101]|uniref:hypothetical protein n=1 Tax=Chroococcus sp. FPU101 TaxID=1974212 RepID=UPI001A8F9DE4|nr:hypothetical protein [Chroococcus sp. FPU101]GFE72043.1 hypothetical protein CFPU101_46530 [Chroococcus sp. FPU101]
MYGKLFKKNASHSTIAYLDAWLSCLLISDDVEKSTELTPDEQLWYELQESQYLAYSDWDLHF